MYHYLPHPKDGEGKSFTLSVHTPGGGGVPTLTGVPTLVRSRRGGVPNLVGGGVPTLGGGYPKVGTPRPGQDGGGTPKIGTPRQGTCYTAGGMPLAFMQEDFLVEYFSSKVLYVDSCL